MDDACRKLIINEGTRLTATFMNNVAVTIIALGSVGPLIGWLYGQPNFVGSVALLLAPACSVVGLTLLVLGRLAWRRMRP